VGLKYIGIGELAASKTAGDSIKTMALGSCVGVAAYNPKIKAAGLLHIALPDSNISKSKCKDNPGRYADTGIPVLIREMMKLGTEKNRDLIIKIIGGAQILDPNDTFNIGKRNILAVKKILWKNSLLLKAEDIGGNVSRTVSINVDDGKIIISSPGRSKWEL
jgi:chemotaxis protein CheD